MSFRPVHPKGCERVATWLLWLGLAGVLRAADPVITNAPAITNQDTPVQKTFLQEIGSHFFKSQPVSQKSPLDSLATLRAFASPAPSPPVQADLQENHSLDPRKDWRFASPDQLSEKFITQEILKLKEYDADGNATGPDAEMARFYQRFFRGTGGTNRTGAYDFFGRLRGEGDSGDETRTRAAGDSERQSVKDFLTSGEENRHASSLADLLGLKSTETPEALRARKEQQAQVEEFKKLIGFQSQPPPVNPGILEPPAGMLSEMNLGRSSYSAPPAPRGFGSPAPASFNNFTAGGLPGAPAPSSPAASPSLSPVLAPLPPARTTPAALNILPGHRGF